MLLTNVTASISRTGWSRQFVVSVFSTSFLCFLTALFDSNGPALTVGSVDLPCQQHSGCLDCFME